MENNNDLTYKVQGITVENFKGLTNIEIELNGEHKTFIGMNGAGKTSIIQAMVMGITGEQIKSNGKKLNKKDYFNLISNGATSSNIDTRLVEIETGKIVVMKRKVNKTSEKLLSITYEDGTPVKHDIFNNLVSQFSIDLGNFFTLSAKQQAQYFGIDTDIYDKAILVAKESVKDANKDKLTSSNKLKALGNPEPVEKASSVAIMAEIELINEHNAKRVEVSTWFKNKKAELDSLNKLDQANRKEEDELIEKLNALKIKIVETGEQALELDKFINTKQADADKKGVLVIKSTDDAKKKLSEVDYINSKAHEYKVFTETQKELTSAGLVWTTTKDTLSQKEAEKVAYLKSVDVPAEIGFDDNGGLLFKGKELDETNLNRAQLLLAIIAICRKQEVGLKTFFIKNINLFDKSTLEKVASLGWQIIGEMVYSVPADSMGAIYIKESEIVDSLEKKSEQIATNKSIFE